MTPEIQNSSKSQDFEKDINLKEIFFFALNNWKWFALSIVICVALAIVYIMVTPKEYSRSATILIRSGNNSGSGLSGAGASIMPDFGMLNFRSSVDNELIMFQAKRLMSEVIARLQLDIDYSTKDKLRPVDLYTQSPIKVVLPDALKRQELSFRVKPLNATEVELSSFSEGELGSITASLGDTIQTSIGRIIVSPTLYYGEQYYNRTVKVDKLDFEKVVIAYNKALNVGLASKQATIIQLSIISRSIPRAEDIINTIIAIYNEDTINDKNQIALNTSRFINERLIIIEQELGSVDTKIEEYMRENRLIDIHSEAGIYLQESSMFSKENLALENQITLAKYIHDYLSNPQNDSELIPSNTGISDSGVERQINEYNAVLLKRNQFLANSSSRNPLVIDMNNSLSAMKQAILRTIDNLIVGLNIKIQNTEARERQTINRITAVPSQSKHVLTIERQQKIKEELYLFLLNKREENELAQAITESNARIVDPAVGSDVPTSPRKMIIMFAALMLGGIIPAGALWLLETLNTTVRDKKEIESALTVPFLGEIPEKEKGHYGEVLVHKSGRDSISEAFRILRTNMDFMRIQTPDMKVITITSAFPGSGKTFIATNLSLSLALTNKKVILLDLDIRKGTLSTRMNAPKSSGITNYLSGQTDDIKSIISKVALDDNLDIIPSGPIPPNPSELLLNSRLEALIEELKKMYDYIVIDNVPTQMIADAFIINRVVDLTIYSVRVGLFERKMLPDLEHIYKQGKLNNMSIVLNGVNIAKYGYGYGYGYGYYGDSEPNS